MTTSSLTRYGTDEEAHRLAAPGADVLRVRRSHHDLHGWLGLHGDQKGASLMPRFKVVVERTMKHVETYSTTLMADTARDAERAAKREWKNSTMHNWSFDSTEDLSEIKKSFYTERVD